MVMRQLWRNLRYSLRALRKNPGFTAVAVLSLALGIGANVAISTLISALVLRDLPVPHPERIVELSVVRHAIYFSYLQDSQPTPSGGLYVRTKGNPEALAMTIGHEVESLGHQYALRTATVDQMMSRVLVNERVIALLSSCFAALALLLASFGVYGLMSYGVTRPNRCSRRARGAAAHRRLDDFA